MKIIAGIITYGFDKLRLKENIDHLVIQVDKIVIVNNDLKQTEELITVVNEYPNIEIIANNSNNLGVATALNQLFEYAQSHYFDWLLTLDQDSVVDKKLIKTQLPYLNANVGILCPKIIDMNKSSKENEYGIVEKMWCITSGSLTNIKAWKDIKGFDEKMFIDLVDTDFCYRLRKANYKILENGATFLNHQLGNGFETSFCGKKIYIGNHNKLRHFYSVRNAIYLNKKGIFSRTELIKSVGKLYFKVILFEDKKIDKLIAMNKGILFGKRL